METYRGLAGSFTPICLHVGGDGAALPGQRSLTLVHRAACDREVPGGLRWAADRAPADGVSVAAGQSRWIGERARRRPGLQAVELDEPTVHVGRATGMLDGHHPRR